MNVSFRFAIIVLFVTAVAITVDRARGSVDEFQCVCAYNARNHVQRVHLMLKRLDTKVVNFSAKYGTLVSRMLFVVNNRTDPTTRWLWLLNLYTNTARQLAWSDYKTKKRMSDGIELIKSDLNPYLQICEKRLLTTGIDWTQETFEKYVLERMTEIVQKTDPKDYQVRQTDFGPRWLYLNDVAANGTEILNKMLMPDIGVDWKTTAGQLSHIYNLSKKNWIFGTQELVLYQKKFLSTVAASLMSYVLIHVMYCKYYWRSNFKNGSSSDNSLVGEYERMWMSIEGLLDKFKSYAVLDSEKYFKTLTEIVRNPLWDEEKFQNVKYTIRTNIVDIGGGLFSLDNIKLRTHSDQDKPLIELIALIDNNISSAEKYLQTIKGLLLGVNFKIIKNFMRSTHIWLT